MNTRLQVEHPVTEAITGLDLVELQLRVAAGKPLPFGQDELSIDGHAFEARIYAEDASKGFLPATGRLDHLRLPDFARVDSGVVEGDAITPHYDSMIAKIVVHGPDRAGALGRLRAALAATRIAGTVTNVGFLARLARHPDFASGAVDTGLIDRDLAALTAAHKPSAEAYAIVALAELGAFDAPAGDDPWTVLRGFRSFGEASQSVAFEGRGIVRVTERGDGASCQTPAGPAELTIRRRGQTPIVEIDGRILAPEFARQPGGLTLFLDGEAREFPRHVPGRSADDALTGDRIVSPMPGTVRLVTAEIGARVEAGSVLVVVEAMKMEHALKSPRTGIVAEILVSLGDQVEDGTLLVRLETGE